MPRLSVIVCTHNPNPTNLDRTLAALQAQDLAVERWELIVIDNASAVPLAPRIDLQWHRQARVCREETLGLIHARLHGLRVASGELIVFVDDDNLLASDYLSKTVAIADTRPWLGAWGATIGGEFASKPPEWIQPYLYGLAVREIMRERWQNLPAPSSAVPAGAGMTVRRSVCDRYLEICNTDPRRFKLGRSGQALNSGEDVDLALTATDIGLGFGIFPELRLTHLIPANRLEISYVSRLMESIEQSHHLLLYLRDASYRPPVHFGEDLLIRWRLRHISPERRLIERSIARGRRNALRAITELARTP
jgi:glycosyltransferase involved in cell wall biosynthesis